MSDGDRRADETAGDADEGEARDVARSGSSGDHAEGGSMGGEPSGDRSTGSDASGGGSTESEAALDGVASGAAVDETAGQEGADAGDEAEPLDPAEVDVAELTGPEQSLEPAVRLVWILRAGLVALVLGAVAGALAVVFSAPVWVGPGLFTVLFGLGGARAHLRYRSWSYRVRTDSLFLDRGVLTRVRTVVPYVRIQHVDASRGPVERAFGLATVVVYTAGSRGADVSIPGLTPERADDLQERLKRLAIAAEGEDAV
jgi:membrane protein YdbS with pleckstrin-like domain